MVMSFKEFLLSEGKPKSPEKAAKLVDRLARKQKFGPEYISHRLSDSEQSAQHIRSRARSPSRGHWKYSVAELPIKKLRPGQKGLDTERIKHYLHNPVDQSKYEVGTKETLYQNSSGTLPRVWHTLGQEDYEVGDGHHRLAAARYRGETHHKVHLGTWHPHKHGKKK
jgi:hypothetical protein